MVYQKVETKVKKKVIVSHALQMCVHNNVSIDNTSIDAEVAAYKNIVYQNTWLLRKNLFEN